MFCTGISEPSATKRDGFNSSPPRKRVRFESMPQTNQITEPDSTNRRLALDQVGQSVGQSASNPSVMIVAAARAALAASDFCKLNEAGVIIQKFARGMFVRQRPRLHNAQLTIQVNCMLLVLMT